MTANNSEEVSGTVDQTTKQTSTRSGEDTDDASTFASSAIQGKVYTDVDDLLGDPSNSLTPLSRENLAGKIEDAVWNRGPRAHLSLFLPITSREGVLTGLFSQHDRPHLWQPNTMTREMFFYAPAGATWVSAKGRDTMKPEEFGGQDVDYIKALMRRALGATMDEETVPISGSLRDGDIDTDTDILENILSTPSLVLEPFDRARAAALEAANENAGAIVSDVSNGSQGRVSEF